jgi:ubiquitin-protein ligase
VKKYNYLSILVWHGVLFVRQGHYKNAILKFQIKYPKEYPTLPPTLIFLSKIYHPLVNLETGELDISVTIL